MEYQPDYQLNYQPDYQPDSSDQYQPDSSNRSISLIITISLIVRTELRCAAASRPDATRRPFECYTLFTYMSLATGLEIPISG